MAHNPSHTNRRKLATPDSASISQKHPNPSSTSTIYNLTNHFSRTRLHPNNSNPNFNPKPANANANGNSHPQKHIEVKALSKSANNSSLSLGQDFRKQGKMVVLDSGKSKSLVVVEDHKKKKGEQNNNNNNNNNSKYNKGKATLLAAGNNGKRRSCSDADVQIELSNFLVTNCAKVVSADMPPFMQIHAVAFARKIKDSLEKFTSKNLAFSLKKELDGVYGPAWHCIVGTSFGSFVTHSVGGFLYFSLDQKLYVLIFKTAVQKA